MAPGEDFKASTRGRVSKQGKVDDMGSRWLMIISALFLAGVGCYTLFAPDKVLGMHGTPPDNATMLLIQMMGALYLGFAALNWTARGVMIGGIYARPIAVGNLVHFTIVAAQLGKAAVKFGVFPLFASTAVYGAFAVWFAVVAFHTPALKKQS